MAFISEEKSECISVLDINCFVLLTFHQEAPMATDAKGTNGTVAAMLSFNLLPNLKW